MKSQKPLWFWIIIGSLSACNNSNKEADTSKKRELYTQQDSINIYGHKFLKKEFNEIVDNFPKLYQEEVLCPDSLYDSEFTNPHFLQSYG